jgi:pyruvate dehydrogenase E2 component (dihydrolipoamide acetyltransferase)
MMATVVHMPEVLTGITEASISTWLIDTGQDVAVGTPLAEIETEKAVIEYASESEGTVLQLLAAAGSDVAVGAPIAVIGAPGESVDPAEPTMNAKSEDAAPSALAGDATAGSSAAPAPAPSLADAPAEAGTADAGRSPASAATVTGERRFVSPLVRRLAKEHGIDLDTIVGSGPNGRVVRRDLEAAEETRAIEAPAAEPVHQGETTPQATSTADDVEEVRLTPMRRAIARRLTESKTTVPHFYLAADIRVEKLLALRQQINQTSPVRVSVNDFVLKAAAGALRALPDANSTWGETVLRRHRSVDIAVAVAIDGGLVTPVVRDVDRLSVGEVSRTVADLADRARTGHLLQHEMEGGSFTVSNLGMHGVTEFSAIINPPHAGILAVGAARELPVVENGELTVGTVMTVTLSADHRVIDGALAAQWLAAFVDRMENPLLTMV